MAFCCDTAQAKACVVSDLSLLQPAKLATLVLQHMDKAMSTSKTAHFKTRPATVCGQAHVYQ